MIPAPIPEDEDERLAVLHRYQILDTNSEERFDDLTRLASQICGVPIALVSLIDEKRQWFKSRHGLELSQTDRDSAFCAHAILQPKLFVVPDALEDERFINNHYVDNEPKIRFYAGAPLITPSGHAVGTLCVLDRTPRELTKEQQDALEILARQVVAQMELRLKIETLQRTVNDLEQSQRELQQRENQMNLLTEELIRSNTELLNFTLVVSHDLQEPLRKIQTFGDRLRSKLKDSLPTDSQTYLDRMIHSAARMQMLINGLLAYSRVTTRKEPFQPVDLNKVLKEVLCDLEGRIHTTNGRVETTLLPEIEADPLQMRQLLQNLIGNALKFHQDDVPPVVRICAEFDDESVRINISDNGIGFEQDQSERIFQVFERLGEPGKREGSGVGLAICRKIVERHHGSIAVKSVVGEGTIFTITLPKQQIAMEINP